MNGWPLLTILTLTPLIGAAVTVLLGRRNALIARRVLGPVQALRDAADAMASGRLDTRVVVRGNDELGPHLQRTEHHSRQM